MAQARPTGSPSTAEMRSLRNATNLRTVSRNDPAVKEILDTSTYSVIYHYDADAGKWQKQKQEGSLFVVHRTKAPEYALFMLNRVTVKNVTIPLIPGEMKATAIDASMLQVARRGEKIKYGIWFTEGTDGVQRFRDTIVRVCGEPSKTGVSARASPLPPTSSTSNNTNAPLNVAAAAAPVTGADDLSRLFASISTVPARPSNQASPQPSTQSPSQSQSQPHTPQPSNVPPHAPLQNQPSQYPVPIPGFPAPGLHGAPFNSAPLPPPVPQSQNAQQQPQQPPAPSAPSYPPGQTVDDLLMSILGPPVTAPPAPMQVGLSYSSGTPSGPPPHPNYPPGPPPGPHLGPHPGHPPGPPMGISGPCAPGPISNYCAPHPSSGPPPPVSAPGPVPAHARMNGNGSAAPPPVNGPGPASSNALRDAVARSVPSSNASTPPATAPAPPDFRAYLADLVMQPHNAWFVDQVFAAYNQNLEREAKRQNNSNNSNNANTDNTTNNSKNSDNSNQGKGQQGPRRGGNRAQRGRNQQQQQQR